MDRGTTPMVTAMHASPPRSRAHRRLVAAVLVLGLVGGPSAFAGPAMAKTKPPARDVPAKDAKDAKANKNDGPPASPLSPAEALEALASTLEQAPTAASPSPDDLFVAVADADRTIGERAAARADAVTASDVANVAVLGATGDRDTATARVADATAVLARTRAVLKVERKRLSGLTVRAYVLGGDDSMQRLRAVASGDTSDAAGGRQVVFTQVLARQRDVTTAAMATADRARAKREVARRAETDAQATLDRAAEVAADRASDRVRAETAEQAAIAAAAKARRSLQSAARELLPQVPLDVPIVGLARLQPDDLAGWFASSFYVPRVATPMTDYARWFIEEGNAEGIRGDIAFAQAVLETGGFTNNDSVAANNFSGIGHCDSCGSGWPFPSPQAGVRAQIQLLKSYAITRPRFVNPLVDRRLRGPAGCCTTWGNLTTVWATDPGYGPKVMSIYTSMVQYALQRRAAGEGSVAPPV